MRKGACQSFEANLTCQAARRVRDDNRLQEFVILARRVPLTNFAEQIGRVDDVADASHHSLPRQLHALPALVAIHRIVASDNGGDFTCDWVRGETACENVCACMC
jgi:hypothetical protein